MTTLFFKLKRYILRILIFSIASTLSFFLIKDRLNISQFIFQINWPLFSLGIFTQLGYLYFMLIPFKRLISAHKPALPLLDGLFLSTLCNSINLSTPYRLDMFVRFLFLKRWVNVSFVAFSQVTFICSTLSLGVGLTLLLLLTSLQPTVMNVLNWHAIESLILCTLIGFSCLFFLKKITWLPNLIQKFQKQLLKLPHPKEVILKTTRDFIAARLCACVGFVIVAYAMHFKLPFLFIALLSVAFFLSQLFVITPGNIGISESVLGLLTLAFLQDLNMGIQLAFFYRVNALASSLLLTLFFGLKRRKRGKNEAIFS